MTHRHITAGAATATVLVAIAALLGACSGTPNPAPSTSSPSTTASPSSVPTTSSPSVDAETAQAEAAILTAYQGYWDAKVSAFLDPTKDPGPELERTAVDTAFADVVSGVFTFRRNGIKVVGTPTLSPEVSDIVTGDGGSARIVDCVDGSNWNPVYIATGESAAVPGLASRLVTTSTAYYYVDHWTIRTSVVDRDAPC